MVISEYENFNTSTSSGQAGPDPERVRVLTPAERTGQGVTDEPPFTLDVLRERLRAAKAAVKTAERAKQVATDLVAYLEDQLAHHNTH